MKAEEAEVFVFPALFAQQWLWFLNQLFPGNPFYNVSAALRLTGSLKLAELEQTFNEIVHRHEALGTTFRMLEGQLVQVIAPVETLEPERLYNPTIGRLALSTHSRTGS